jgi:hypothetical protein
MGDRRLFARECPFAIERALVLNGIAVPGSAVYEPEHAPDISERVRAPRLSRGPNARGRGYLAGSLDLRANEAGEFVGRARSCLCALTLQLVGNVGELESAGDFPAYPVDDCTRCRGGCEHAPPVLILVTGQASLRDRWHVWQRG